MPQDTNLSGSGGSSESSLGHFGEKGVKASANISAV